MFDGRTVLHAVSSNRLAGTERHVIALTQALRDLGCDARLVCRNDAQVLARAARARGVPVAEPRSLLARGAAVIHAHDGQAALASVCLGRRGGSAVVRTQHFMAPASANRDGLTGRLSRRAHHIINRRCRGQIMVSESVLTSAREREDLGASHVTVIPSGIELPSRAASLAAADWRRTHRQPILVTAGRLEPERHIDVLLRALPAVLERVPGCRLVIAGDGSAADELHSLAHRLAIAHAIEWTGWVPDLGRVLERAHIYINTWPLEAFGMATAEAMSYGLAPVVPDRGAAQELVERGISGMTFEADNVDALINQLHELLGDLELVAQLGTAAAKRARSYAIEDVAVRTLTFYRSLLETPELMPDVV